MIEELTVHLPASSPSSYPIYVGPRLLEQSSLWMPKNKTQAALITDSEVAKLYAPLLEKALNQAGYKTTVFSFPAGEQSKTITTKCQLEKKLFQHGFDRDSLIIALGGGVVGDLAGFIAATFMRGISYIQIPTTLLAMVDSSLGGKTGIDTEAGKNLIGAFWQPTAVVADLACLKTLSRQQFINGLIEAVKMFLTHDKASLLLLEQNLEACLDLDEAYLRQFIVRAINIKAKVVEADEKESRERAVLNFGHTIGHALEYMSQYQLLHGYAVGLGILVEAKMAQLMGHLAAADYAFICAFMKRLGLNGTDLLPFDIDKLIASTQSDKKKKQGMVRYVLLSGLGTVYKHDEQYVHPVSIDMIKEAFSAVCADQ